VEVGLSRFDPGTHPGALPSSGLSRRARIPGFPSRRRSDMP